MTTFGRHQKCEKLQWLSFVGTFFERKLPGNSKNAIQTHLRIYRSKFMVKNTHFFVKNGVFLDILLQSPSLILFFQIYKMYVDTLLIYF